MGFRCLKCHADFGNDKNALNAHMQICGVGLTEEDIIENSEEIVETMAIKTLVIDELKGQIDESRKH
jgi:hypothetical protein